MMSEMQSKFELSGNWPLVTTVDMDLKAIVNNHTYKVSEIKLTASNINSV